MKSLIVLFIFIINGLIFGQEFQNNVKTLKSFADSLDNVILNSEGIPGEIFCNTVTVMRNERAIGLQETKISFYFMQKDDSVYDDGNEVRFYQVYNPPVKILIEYNIAASQNVKICYYFYDKFIYYTYKSTGEYGYEEKKYVITKSDIKYTVKYDAEGKSPVEEKYKDFNSEEKTQWGKIYTNWLDYEKLYFQTFNAGQLDK